MRDIPTKVDGVSTLPAAEFNDMTTELENFITTSGQLLSSGDLTQLAKASNLQALAGNFYTDSGTANACTLANTYPAVASYTTGMEIRFLKGTTNSGATTVNVNGIGSVNLLHPNGNALQAGDLAAGQYVVARYNGSAFVVVPDATFAQRVFNVSATTALTSAQYRNSTIVVTVGVSNIDITLPALANVPDGTHYTIIRNGGASNIVLTIVGNGGELINTNSQYRMYITGSSLRVVKTGSVWSISAMYDPLIMASCSSNTSIASGSAVQLALTPDASTTVNAGWIDTGTNQIVTRVPGLYLVQGAITFNTTGTYSRTLKSRYSGVSGISGMTVNPVAADPGASVETMGFLSITTPSTLPIDFTIRQDSGGSLNIVSSVLRVILFKRYT